MGKQYEHIDDAMRRWITAQRLFFVGTAPLAVDGHINLSPKGHDALRVLGSKQLAYLDLSGSGVETIAHLRENARIVIMLCAFEGPPRIVRFHGSGRVITPDHARFAELRSQFDDLPAVRSIIVIDVKRIADSCGYGVPFYAYRGERPSTRAYVAKHGEQAIAAYRETENAMSIDGLPGITAEEAWGGMPRPQ